MASDQSIQQEDKLTPEQTHALFDILSHHEVYSEITAFKTRDAVLSYGFPFSSTMRPETTATTITTPTDASDSSTPSGFGFWRSATSSTMGTGTNNTPRSQSPSKDVVDAEGTTPQQGPSQMPVLQTILTRLLLPAPGLRSLPPDFWSVRIQGLLARLGDAELSESYDKGALGLRKTLATLSSAVIEMLGRGLFGGVAKLPDGQYKKTEEAEYDRAKVEELERAWADVLEGLIYGDMIDRAMDHLVTSDNLEDFSPASRAGADYVIIHLATFLHHIFVLSPEGAYLLKLIENVHSLLPYKMIKQTLRVGNAATMINGMMRLLLAKLSVTSITNWVGLTNNSDDGMNLLQRIISLVLSWDASDFRKGAEKIERSNNGVADVLQVIKKFVNDESRREEHLAVRTKSQDSGESIIVAILEASQAGDKAAKLTQEQHQACQEYYSALLSVRDREAITSTLCRQPPDLFTQMVKDAVAAYEPIIRAVHEGVDLKQHLDAGQGFIDDFIKAGKPKKASSTGRKDEPASVEDYVDLLMKNRPLLYRWFHAVAKGCPGVWEDFRVWLRDFMSRFRQEKPEGLSADLNELYTSVAPEQRKQVLAAIDAHADFLSNLSTLSRSRLQHIIDQTSLPTHPAADATKTTTTATPASNANGISSSQSSTMAGPGLYLTRWQNLLDETLITPQTAKGSIRHGKDVKFAVVVGKTVATAETGLAAGAVAAAAAAAGTSGRSEGQGGVPEDIDREKVKGALDEEPLPANVDIVTSTLGPGYQSILRRLGGPET